MLRTDSKGAGSEEARSDIDLLEFDRSERLLKLRLSEASSNASGLNWNKAWLSLNFLSFTLRSKPRLTTSRHTRTAAFLSARSSLGRLSAFPSVKLRECCFDLLGWGVPLVSSFFSSCFFTCCNLSSAMRLSSLLPLFPLRLSSLLPLFPFRLSSLLPLFPLRLSSLLPLFPFLISTLPRSSSLWVSVEDVEADLPVF